MFFNEFKLLDLKIAEQIDFVDKIIIVEAEKTHSNKDKRVLLYNNPSYEHPKLKKVLVPSNKFSNNATRNEAYQRDVALDNIEIQDDDIILSCDLDEILPAKGLEEVIKQIQEYQHVRLAMKLYYYKINMLVGGWNNAIGLTGKSYKESGKTLTQLRHEKKGKIIPTLGKHFSYLGSPEKIKLKLESFLHHKSSRKITLDYINEKIEQHENLFRKDGRKAEIVNIDETYPDAIRNNLEDWKEWIA